MIPEQIRRARDLALATLSVAEFDHQLRTIEARHEATFALMVDGWLKFQLSPQTDLPRYIGITKRLLDGLDDAPVRDYMRLRLEKKIDEARQLLANIQGDKPPHDWTEADHLAAVPKEPA